MAEIKVSITELNNAITKLQNLQKRCTASDTKAPPTVGGGKTVNELETIAGIYKSMNIHFNQLLSNTISFLNNVKTSYEENDRKAAQKMNIGDPFGGGNRF